ncbi:benzoate diol dehydrogenase BenD [Nesterenkonia sphaerica]|uniref:1,6-dihydroxycyclohexa-2,4-diene-1-carboxylate dehydrogenase n=1 Tax=Nesterenkonia sphaerica TaxID=1804988 RepID=A0A5R9AMZ9_9MICC|nr:benzoate diol dehydrogenase BenD [Nesterenkonia sphaerica]TLP79972.1 1,6-dihydroxycyclohexa-2,4-diene-1-carboxylate dehydrogenase [Nesterenkonia sphaerica]
MGLEAGLLDGKNVLVTGAAQGIGREVAVLAARQGAELILADRSELVEDTAQAAAAAAGEHRRQLRCLTALADLETWEGAEDVAYRATSETGDIDVCINAVGGTIWAKPYDVYEPDRIEAEIRRSLFPTMWMCRAVLPGMKQRGTGTIVNVSSVATRGINRGPYSAAKGGVNALTASLAMESAEAGVRVVATAPGGTEAPPRRIPRGPGPESDQEKAWFGQVVDQTLDSSAFGRYGTLAEQAWPIVFLASDAASYITGSVLPVAGGDQG